MLFKYKIISKPLLVLALSLTSYSSYADQSHCGSGPYIEGGRGDNHIQIRPSGNRYFDSMNLKWAINNVSENGSIKLCEGTFDLVAHRFRKKTSFKIRKNIAIQGVRDNDTLKTAIKTSSLPEATLNSNSVGPFSADKNNEVDFSSLIIKNDISQLDIDNASIVNGILSYNILESDSGVADTCPYSEEIEMFKALSPAEVLAVFKTLDAPFYEELNGEYASTNLDHGSILQNTISYVSLNNPLLGQWLGKAFKPFVYSYNMFEHAIQGDKRLFPMQTEMANSIYDGKPVYRLNYGYYDTLLAKLNMVDEVRKIDDGFYLGIGTTDTAISDGTEPLPFLLCGPIGEWVGTDKEPKLAEETSFVDILDFILINP